MATQRGRKTPPRKNGKTADRPVSFVVVIGIAIALFIIVVKLMPDIQKGWEQFSGRLKATESNSTATPTVPPATSPPAAEKPAAPPQTAAPKPAPPAAEKPAAQQPPAAKPATPTAAPTAKPQPAAPTPAPKPPATPPSAATPPPAAKPATPPPAAKPPAAAPPAKAVETRSRTVYFARSGSGGDLIRSPAARQIAVSDSPLLDALNALLAGPSAEEQRRGFASFIPPNSRVLSAMVQGSTAYINFNEDFQFNTWGQEGCAIQTAQVVWTATEFPNVQDVQILIEGRRVDYLGEGIWIGSPVNRGIQTPW